MHNINMVPLKVTRKIGTIIHVKREKLEFCPNRNGNAAPTQARMVGVK